MSYSNCHVYARYAGRNSNIFITYLLLRQPYLYYTLVAIQTAATLRYFMYSFVLWWEYVVYLCHKVFIVLFSTFMAQ